MIRRQLALYLALVCLLGGATFLGSAFATPGAPQPGQPDPIRVNGWRIRSGTTATIYDLQNNAGPVFTDAGTTMNSSFDGDHTWAKASATETLTTDHTWKDDGGNTMASLTDIGTTGSFAVTQRIRSPLFESVAGSGAVTFAGVNQTVALTAQVAGTWDMTVPNGGSYIFDETGDGRVWAVDRQSGYARVIFDNGTGDAAELRVDGAAGTGWDFRTSNTSDFLWTAGGDTLADLEDIGTVGRLTINGLQVGCADGRICNPGATGDFTELNSGYEERIENGKTIRWYENGTEILRLSDATLSGYPRFDSDQGGGTPGAVDFADGLNIGSGTNMEIDVSQWFTGAINFGAITDCEDGTITATGAVVGDQCSLGTTLASFDANLQFQCYVAADVITIRACCNASSAGLKVACANPASVGFAVRTFRR